MKAGWGIQKIDLQLDLRLVDSEKTGAYSIEPCIKHSKLIHFQTKNNKKRLQKQVVQTKLFFKPQFFLLPGHCNRAFKAKGSLTAGPEKVGWSGYGFPAT